jgi:plasmid stabilization system protein ParE
MAEIVRWTQRSQHEFDKVVTYYEVEYSALAAENLLKDAKKEIEK